MKVVIIQLKFFKVCEHKLKMNPWKTFVKENEKICIVFVESMK